MGEGMIDDIPKKMGIEPCDFRVVVGRTTIAYDINKDDANREKHGYSLASAALLLENWVFLQPDPFITHDPTVVNGEVRHKHIGLDDAGEVVFMVTTMRPDETVRVISFRRASCEERDIFYNLTGYDKNKTDKK